jgi:hypothetical protein
LVVRAHLMLFYFEGAYYHMAKRTAGIRYIFMGKPTQQRPRSDFGTSLSAWPHIVCLLTEDSYPQLKHFGVYKLYQGHSEWHNRNQKYI